MSVASVNSGDCCSLPFLRSVFDECLQKLDAVYGECDRAQLVNRQQLIGTRIIELAEQGITDPDQLEKRALAGLLPEFPH